MTAIEGIALVKWAGIAEQLAQKEICSFAADVDAMISHVIPLGGLTSDGCSHVDGSFELLARDDADRFWTQIVTINR